MSVARSRLTTARALAHQTVLAELVPALRARGIRPLLIKGPATVRLLYREDPDTRDADDIDLLVSDADFGAAEAVLAEHGFRHRLESARPSELPRYERTWLRDQPLPVAIDLHRALRLVPRGASLFEVLCRDAVEMPIGATMVQAPSDAASTLLVALHAADHGSTASRPLADLRRAVSLLPALTWQQAAELAAELGVRGEMRLGLQTVPEGRSVLERLQLTEQAPLRARVQLEGSRRLVALAQTRDLRSALGLLRDGLLPSPAMIRVNPKLQVGPGRLSLLLAYPRRWLLIPRSVIPVLVESARSASTVLSEILPVRMIRYLRTLAWAFSAVRRTRQQLRVGDLASVAVRPAPPAGRGARRGLRDGLRLAKPSCLERSLVRRFWHLRQGREVPIVIGVRGGGENFGAHAWLRGDPPDPGDFTELLVWPDDRVRR
jgi:hypothetical protein